MPTATAAAPKKKPFAKASPEVESKEDQEVIVDPNLNKRVEEWGKSTEKAERTWMVLAAYVRDKQITSKQLFTALVEVKGLAEASARVETSRLMRFTKSEEASDMLDRALEGDEEITVRDLRGANVLSGDKAEKDPQEKLDKMLVKTARYAIREAEVEEQSDFVMQAKRSWKVAYNAELKAQQKENGDESDESETTEEEDDTE